MGVIGLFYTKGLGAFVRQTTLDNGTETDLLQRVQQGEAVVIVSETNRENVPLILAALGLAQG